jgi:deoxycytidine triphosphate deaminase
LRWVVARVRELISQEPEPRLVIDDVHEEGTTKYVVIQNPRDNTVDLSNASLTDEADNRFRFDEEFALDPKETYALRVNDSFITDPDPVLVLTTRDGEEYEIR